jgi:hypothetical protein
MSLRDPLVVDGIHDDSEEQLRDIIKTKSKGQTIGVEAPEPTAGAPARARRNPRKATKRAARRGRAQRTA